MRSIPATRPTTSTSRRWRVCAAITATALAISALPGVVGGGVGSAAAATPTAPAAPPAATVTADALPTAQIDGVAWSQVVVGSTVYVAGSFQHARPAGAAPGVDEVRRSNLLAYNIETGELIDDFAPDLNAQALAVAASPDGSRIYVGGDFTEIDGNTVYRIAAFDTATGALDASFAPVVGSQVRALSVTADRVYLGGTFRSVDGVPRTYLASIATATHSLLRWAPSTNAPVNALARTTKSLVVVGGRFTRLAGADRRGIGAVDASTGAGKPWAVSSIVRNSGPNSAITSLYATSDRVYGTGYVWNQQNGRLEGAFSVSPTTGKVAWIEDCHGDSYSVFPTASVIYVASHSHECDTIGGFPQTSTPQRLVAFTKAATGKIRKPSGAYFNFSGHPSPSLITWFPSISSGHVTGQGQGAWSVSGNTKYVVAGGEFESVNGVPQAGLTRFAARTVAPQNLGPHLVSTLSPQAKVGPTGVTLSWRASWDDDDALLRYQVVRDGDTRHPLLVRWATSTFYNRPTMTFVDQTAWTGTHRYTIVVADAAGNTVQRSGGAVSVPTGSPVVNEPPTASFTAVSAGPATTFDASASGDPDDAVASYSWDYGDGSSGTGVSATHSYATSRTYAVTLTVRDTHGGIGITTRAVTPGASDESELARDSFDRDLPTGWGSADRGGDWATTGASSSFSVGDTGGQIALGAGSTRAALLSGVTADASPVDVRATFALDALPTGTGTNVSVIGRQVDASSYTASAWVRPSGDVVLVLRRATETLASVPIDVPGAAADVPLTLRLQLDDSTVDGVAATTLRARVWSANHIEPGQWMATAVDSTPGMQQAGAAGVQTSLSTAATRPLTTTFGDFVVRLPH